MGYWSLPWHLLDARVNGNMEGAGTAPRDRRYQRYRDRLLLAGEPAKANIQILAFGPTRSDLVWLFGEEPYLGILYPGFDAPVFKYIIYPSSDAYPVPTHVPSLHICFIFMHHLWLILASLRLCTSPVPRSGTTY